ncbi:3'-5' exoribonuclease [Rhizobium sp. S153]|uniref:3'-5' exoribonuclease n=1 Tax=Ciceribacter sichuanensis TaxID=2949647 RepID=A0ABT0V670_9HYPH|nr:3'-5' exoribonuclease [Ciceribacter sp. S153]MCM2401376.1 3'-5' exoribonuclease [Ciceribacter sp. S153]
MSQTPTYYFVTDIETNGPDPLHHSMLSFATVVLRSDGALCGEFEAVLQPRPDRQTDDRTMGWWKTQPEAWMAATTDPEDPAIVMKRFVDWIENFSGQRAFAARPVMFDGLWIDHYLKTFADRFLLDAAIWGHCVFNRAPLDIGTYLLGVFGKTEPPAGPTEFPAEWLGHHPHTHRAINDARGYASLLSKLFEVARELPANPLDFTRVQK